MTLEVIVALILCGFLALIVLPVMLRLLRVPAKVRLDQAIDKLIEEEEQRMKARYGE